MKTDNFLENLIPYEPQLAFYRDFPGYDDKDFFAKVEARAEPLHPDLVDWVEGCFIKHPLLVEPYHSSLAAETNLRFLMRRAHSKELLDAGELGQYIWRHEKPYLLQALSDVADQLDDESYWYEVSHIYTYVDNVWQWYDEWRQIFTSGRPGRWMMMNGDELLKLEGLPDIVTVYRGYSKGGRRKGLSWTLNKAAAIWFAQYRGEPLYTTVVGQVRKEDIIAVLDDRKEDEVIALPEHVIGVKTIDITDKHIGMPANRWTKRIEVMGEKEGLDRTGFPSYEEKFAST